MNTKNKQTLENAYQSIVNESNANILESDPIIKEVVAIYNLDIKYNEKTGNWFVLDKRKQPRETSGFYLDSNFDRQDFFNNLREYFYNEGYHDNRW
jgi:hypothetical protein